MADTSKQRFQCTLSCDIVETVSSDGSAPSPQESKFFNSVPLQYHNLSYPMMQFVESVAAKHFANLQNELLSLGGMVGGMVLAGMTKEAIHSSVLAGPGGTTPVLKK